MKIYYCWQCKMDMPFLDDSEWALIEPHLKQGILDIKEYRAKMNVDITGARVDVRSKAMQLFNEITGMGGVHADVIQHHHLRRECTHCGHLLRTSKAIFCANCWQKRNSL